MGLGSCVAVAIRDRGAGTVRSRTSCCRPGRRAPPRRTRTCASTRTSPSPRRSGPLEIIGCRRADLEAKIAGGRAFSTSAAAQGGDIGGRNVEAVVGRAGGARASRGRLRLGGARGGRWNSVDSGELAVKTVRGARRTHLAGCETGTSAPQSISSGAFSFGLPLLSCRSFRKEMLLRWTARKSVVEEEVIQRRRRVDRDPPSSEMNGFVLSTFRSMKSERLPPTGRCTMPPPMR